jgi:hypothetical protein
MLLSFVAFYVSSFSGAILDDVVCFQACSLVGTLMSKAKLDVQSTYS